MVRQKQRLDLLLVEQNLVESRARAQALIMAGEVSVNGIVVDKPGTSIDTQAHIALKSRPPFVSRGGEKLAAALDAFAFDPAGRIAADVGASTGGFTDCLLQRGVTRVYAIDVGYGLLAQRVRDDARVVIIERTNARYLTALPEKVNLVVVDASFISLRLLLPVITGWLTLDADIMTLIKPQFEAGRDDIGKGGVVRDARIHRRVITEVVDAAQTLGLCLRGLTTSVLKGPAGNTEYVAWFSRQPLSTQSASALIDSLFS